MTDATTEATDEADAAPEETDEGAPETEGTTEEADSTTEAGSVGFEDLLTRTDEVLEMIESKADEDELGPLLSQLDDVEDVIDEAEDVLSTMDLSELVGAVDWESLPDAVDASKLPDAIGEGDLGDAIDVRELLAALDVSALFDNVDELELWREKREFDDELEDVRGEGSDDGAGGFDLDVDVDRESLGDDVDPRAVQAAVQREISGAVGEFREKLIEAHHRLDEIREENEARFDEKRNRTRSRNPTAGFSTMPRGPTGTGGATRHSTVPEETKYSTAPNRKRIYGDRFESAGGDDGG